nr:xylulose kinase-1 [Tanacetum cinerariifolium]
MKIHNFISSSNLLCWNIVLKGNSAKSLTIDNDGNLKIRPPVTAKEHQQVQREEKARTILHSALPDEHMGDFYHMIDKFEEFKISKEEGLDKGYDKMQKILTQMNTLKIKPDPEDVNMKFLRGLHPSWSGIALILKTKGGLEYISFDDLYNKLKFLEINTKGYSSSSSTLSNAAFVSTAGSSQGNLSYQESGNGGHATTFSVFPSSSSFKGSSKSKCSVVDDMNKEEFKEYDQSIRWQCSLSRYIDLRRNMDGRSSLMEEKMQGNSAKSLTTDNDGNLKIRHPVTAKEHQQNAIKARFGRNVESKKMQKSLLKQKFEEFKISKEEGLDKGYDKMKKILTQMNTLKIKPDPEDINTKGYSSSSSTLSNAAFVSTAGSSQGNLSYQESGNGGHATTFSVFPSSSYSKGSSKSKCSVVDDVIYSFFANHEIDQHLVYEDLDQMNKEEFEEYDQSIRWQCSLSRYIDLRRNMDERSSLMEEKMQGLINSWQSSPPPTPFGPTPSSGVVSTEPIPDIPSSSGPSKPVLDTITSPIRDDDTGGGFFHESPPRPPPATLPRSPTVGVAEEPLTLTSLLAMDTVVLFAKRIKKLESKLKTKKRKLVLSDSENEEEARQSKELDALLDLANAALYEPSPSTTPSKPANLEQSLEQEISPTTLDAVLTLSYSKARARVATIIYKRLKKQQSSSGLDFMDAAIPAAGLDSAGGLDSASGVDSASGLVFAGGLTSVGISIAAGPTVPAEPSSPIRDPSKGKAVATPSTPELKKSIDAEQVYLDSLLAQRVVEEQVKESMASTVQSTHMQAELDKVALNITNEEWIGLVDQVRANPTLSAELLGADVSEDTFSVRMVELMNKRQKEIAEMKAKAKREKPMNLAQQKDVRGLTDDQLQIVYDKIRQAVDLATAKDHHQNLKRPETTSVSADATIAAGDPIPAVTFVSAASSIPIATPIAAGVSATAGASDLLNAPLRKSSRNKSIARKRTLPSPSKPKSDALPFDEDDPEAAFKRYLRQASNDDEPADLVSLALVSDITTWEIIPTEFGLGEIHVITRADGTVKRFSTLRELMYWAGRADLMVLYDLVLDKYKTERATETKAGDIMYMFVDKKYPLTPETIQRMLNHGLEIDRFPSDLLKVCRALTMPVWVLNYPTFKVEEIVMAIITCLKSSGVHYQCFTVKCALLWQTSPPPTPFGPTPSSGVVYIEPIPDIPSSSGPSKPVLDTITSPIRDDDTGGGFFHESPPRPPPATLPRSPTATKILHRDTVVLFAKRIKKLESKLKTKKRKLVLSDSENKEEARQSKELDALLDLANTALYEPSPSTTPSKPANPEQSSEQEISPTTLDASSSGLDFTDAAIPAAGLDSAGGLDSASGVDSASGLVFAGGLTSVGISVAAGPTVLAEPSSPIRDPSKGKAVATPSTPELKQSIDAEQVYLDSLLAQRVVKEQVKESMASTVQSTHMQPELDKVALNLTNEEWIGLVDQVRANPTLSAELLGADVSEDTFSVRMVELMNKRQKEIAEMKAKPKREKPMNLAQQKEFMRTLWTWKDVRGLTDDQLQINLQETTYVSAGATIAAGDPIPAVTFVSTASSIPVATPIAAGVSATAGASDLLTEEHNVPLRKSSRKKSIARKRTLPSPSKPKSDALPFEEDDPEAAFKRYLRQASDDDEPADLVSLALVSDITTWEIIPTEFGLGEIHVITRADETEAGDIMYMFMDKKYPLTPETIQWMLNHGLEIDRFPSDYLPFSTLLVHQRFNKDKQKGFKDDHGASSSKFKIIMLLLILLAVLLSILTLLI